MEKSANDKVNEFLIYKFIDRNSWHPSANVPDPADLTVVWHKMENGDYGCDTGCEYARLTAGIKDKDGTVFEFEYGTFGDISSILGDIDRFHGDGP